MEIKYNITKNRNFNKLYAPERKVLPSQEMLLDFFL